MMTYAVRPPAQELKLAPKILVVDHPGKDLDMLELSLLRADYKVLRASDDFTALQLYLQQRPDLIMLEINLPRSGGLELLRRLRNQLHSRVPVIVVSSATGEEDKVQCLEEGADDYITKPFSVAELMMRVKVALRRKEEHYFSGNADSNQEIISAGNLYINKTRHRVEVNGEEIELRPKEFELLWYLASHPGRVFSRDQLLEEIWNYASFGDLSTITVHMRRLREKVEVDPMRPRHLKTVWGLGYKFEP